MIANPPRITTEGTVLFRPAWSLGVPAVPGVYLIHDLRGTLYIGRAESLRRRFEEHYFGTHNGALRIALKRNVGQINFSWISSAGTAQVDLERDLIQSMRPLCNVQHNTTEADGCTPSASAARTELQGTEPAS